MNYLTLTDVDVWCGDIEADGLTPTVVHCLCVKNVKTGERLTLLSYEEILKFVTDELSKGSLFIFHNGLGYDVPVLNRLVGTRIPVSRVIDTMVMSMLYSPSLQGGHSLEAWGNRLGNHKGTFKGPWDVRTDEMVDYCIQDVEVGADVWLKLSKRMLQVGFSEKSVEIEHHAWFVIQKQKKIGFRFDIPKAHGLYVELRRIEKELQDAIYRRFPPRLTVVASYKSAYKKDRTRTSNYERHLGQFPRLEDRVDGGYDAYDFVSFNLGSPKQRVEKLLELGWEPLEFTPPSKTNPRGNPKPTAKGELSPSLEKFAEDSGIQEVRLIAQWITINSRANTINGWITLAEKDGRIHGNLWLANTLRYRHDNPNTANIPAVRPGPDGPRLGLDGWFTFESRDLWVPSRSDRSLVGVDAKGIQLRILANSLKNKDYADEVVNGDPHTYTQSITGVGTRANNKNFIYAYLLGGGPAKLGFLLGITPKEAKSVMALFPSRFPGLKQLLARLEGEIKRSSRLTLCDGSRCIPPQTRLALAYLLQGDESRIMRRVVVEIDRFIRRERLDVQQVGFIHDELQFDTPDDLINDEQFRQEILRCFNEAGEWAGYWIPIDGDISTGKSWARSH